MAESIDDFVAGWVSGAVGVALTQPLDYMTTRLQSGKQAAFGSGGSIRTLFRGVGPLLSTVPLNNALLFYGYGIGVQASVRDAPQGGTASLAPIFIGGCAGGAAQSFLQSPVELVKVRMQLAASGSVPTTSSAVAHLAQGRLLFSRGLSATLLRDVVPHGIWFATYEWAKRSLSAKAAGSADAGAEGNAAEQSRLSTLAQLSAGATAATVAWIVCADSRGARGEGMGGRMGVGGWVRADVVGGVAREDRRGVHAGGKGRTRSCEGSGRCGTRSGGGRAGWADGSDGGQFLSRVSPRPQGLPRRRDQDSLPNGVGGAYCRRRCCRALL